MGDLMRMKSCVLHAEGVSVWRHAGMLLRQPAWAKEANRCVRQGQYSSFKCANNTHTQDKVVVLVEAGVVNPEARTSHPTNTFTFTFRAAPGRGQQRLRRVLPGEPGDLQRLRSHFAEAAL